MGKRLTTENFIEKAQQVHSNRYTYPRTDYVKAIEKVVITCNIHGDFEQTPNSHLSGYGCKKCSNSTKLMWTKEYFVSEVLKRNNGYLPYDIIGDYRGTTENILVSTLFGKCSVRANHLLSGIKPTIMTALNKTDYWINQVEEIHNKRYDYSLSEYVNAKTPLKIICTIHGEFNMTPDAHISGSGCKECAKKSSSTIMGEKTSGWGYKNWQKSAELSKNFDSFKLYIIHCWNEDEEFYKIGRTFKKVKSRFSSKKRMPYNFVIIKEILSTNAKYICDLESDFKKCNKSNSYIPLICFNGVYECFKKLDLSCFEEYELELIN